MPRTPEVELRRARGTWIAEADDGRSRRLLGHDAVPVMRDHGDGAFVWAPSPPGVRRAYDGAGGASWTRPEQGRRRDLMRAGVLTWVRQVEPSSEDAPTRGVGRSVGVFRAGNVVSTAGRVGLARVAEVAR